MHLFSGFCNICYKTDNGSFKDISEENMKNLKNILITFVGHADIINDNLINLCQVCCEELTRSNKFREMCFTNLIQLRQSVVDMKCKLELENGICAAQNALQIFVNQEILRRNSLFTSICPISAPTEYETVTRSVDSSQNDSVFNRQRINVQSERNEYGFPIYYNDVSVENNSVAECDEPQVTFTNVDPVFVKCEAVYGEDFECTEEQLHVKNEIVPNAPEDFARRNFERKSGEHVNRDAEMPVVNNSERIIYPGIEYINEEYHVKDEYNISQDKSTAATIIAQPSATQVHELYTGNWPPAPHSVGPEWVYPNTEPHTCTVCNKFFKTSTCLTRHERTHNTFRPYQCTVCNKAYADATTLTNHERTHSTDKPYKCSFCNKSFKQTSNLIVHERIHNGDRPYKCTICNKGFRQSSNLIVHERTHSGDKPYKCSFCDKAFTDSSTLTVHERIHSGNRPYKCGICNKEFTQLSALTKHERTHSGDRPYICIICNKTFTVSSALIRHTRSHSGDRPYKCSVCNKSFIDSSHLTVHKRSHSGDRPYECTVCNKKFIQSSNLAAHSRLHNVQSN